MTTRPPLRRRPDSFPHSLPPRLRGGFTIVELLVVISIITLLISILLPVIASAREAARRITCASNLRQMGIATAVYINDYEKYMINSSGASNRSGMNLFKGDAPSAGVLDSLQEWYAHYLLGGASLDQANVDNEIRFEPTDAFECPSSNLDRSDSSESTFASYGYFTGSTLKLDLTPEALADAAKRMRNYSVGNYEGTGTSRSAIWADHAYSDAYEASNNFPALTNHRDGSETTGGNVLEQDGAVQWFPFAGEDENASRSFAVASSLRIHNAGPTNAITPVTNDADDGTIARVLVGAQRFAQTDPTKPFHRNKVFPGLN